MSGSRFWNSHDISRRRFIARTGAVTLAAFAAGAGDTLAQAPPDASPRTSPEATPITHSGPVGAISPSRESELARLAEQFDFEDVGSEGGTFTYAQTSDLTTLNPLLVSDTDSGLVTGLTHDGLMATSPIDGAWVPRLADLWEIAGDALAPNGFNASAYKSEAYNAITPRANREFDDEKRIALIAEQTNIVNDDAAVGVVVFPKSISGANPRIQNLYPNGFGTFRALPGVWLDPA